MANTVVTLEIAEPDVSRVNEATKGFTGNSGSLKERLAATAKRVVVDWERETHTFPPPGIS